MTLETMYYVESTPEIVPLSELLTVRKEEVHRELGRLSIERSVLSDILAERINENIQLNNAAPEADAETQALRTLRKEELRKEIGRLMQNLSNVGREYTHRIGESVALNAELANAGVDTQALARQLQAQQPHEESPLFHNNRLNSEEPSKAPIPIRPGL